MRRLHQLWLFAPAAAAALVLLAYRTGVGFPLIDGHVGGVLILAAFALLGLAGPVFAPSYGAAYLVLLAVGVTIGVITDTLVDWFTRKVDRNLFPIELVVWLGVLCVPTLVGYLAGRLSRRWRTREP